MIRRPPRSTLFPSPTLFRSAYNRRDSVRIVLEKMLHESDYEGDVEVIVVDNASTDGTADMLRQDFPQVRVVQRGEDRKSTRLNSSHANISYAVFCLKKKKRS